MVGDVGCCGGSVSWCSCLFGGSLCGRKLTTTSRRLAQLVGYVDVSYSETLGQVSFGPLLRAPRAIASIIRLLSLLSLLRFGTAVKRLSADIVNARKLVVSECKRDRQQGCHCTGSAAD